MNKPTRIILECTVFASPDYGRCIIIRSGGLAMIYGGYGLDPYKMGDVVEVETTDHCPAFGVIVRNAHRFDQGVGLLRAVNLCQIVDEQTAEKMIDQELRGIIVHPDFAAIRDDADLLEAVQGRTLKQAEAQAKPQTRPGPAALDSRLAAPASLVGRAWYDARTIEGNRAVARDPRGRGFLLDGREAADRERDELERSRRIAALNAAAPAGPCPGCSGQPDRCSLFLPAERWCESELAAGAREELEAPLSTALGERWLERQEEEYDPELHLDERPVLSDLCQDALTLGFCWLLSSASLIASPWRGLRSRVVSAMQSNSNRPQPLSPNSQPPTPPPNRGGG